MDYLVFRLYGSMASWGEIAVGESRHSATRPSKSAIIGLLASALGIRREQEELLNNLTNGYLLAIKVLRSGQILKDYHTAQAPDAVGKFRYCTRRDEIFHGKDRLGTVLSSREYRSDSHIVIALKPLSNSPYDVQELKKALSKPKFHLYLGRKSCPLAAPLNASIISAENFRQALDNFTTTELLPGKMTWDTDDRWLPQDSQTHYYWEGNVEDFSVQNEEFSSEHVQTLSRHDKPVSRIRWQFESRTEYLWLQSKELA